MVELIAERRKSIGHQVKSLRRNGQLPAVLYGADNESQPISVDTKSFGKVLKEAGESTLVELVVDGKKHNVLIHDVQVDPLTDLPIHADFLSVRMDKEIHAKIPLEFIGESPAVKGESGILVKVMHEIEIEALPKDLPHALRVDISVLEELKSKIHVRDLGIPAGVKILGHFDDVIVLIEAPRTEEELKEVVEIPVAEAVAEVKTEREMKTEEKVKKEVEEKAKEFSGKKDVFVRKAEISLGFLERESEKLRGIKEEFDKIKKDLGLDIGNIKDELDELKRYEQLKISLDKQVEEQKTASMDKLQEVTKQILMERNGKPRKAGFSQATKKYMINC